MMVTTDSQKSVKVRVHFLWGKKASVSGKINIAGISSKANDSHEQLS